MHYNYYADRVLIEGRKERRNKPIYPSCSITCNKYGKRSAHRIKCDKCRDKKICMWEH